MSLIETSKDRELSRWPGDPHSEGSTSEIGETPGALEPSPLDAPREKGAKARLVRWAKDPNLARQMDQGDLDRIGQVVVFEYDLDEHSRDMWREDAEKAMKFATQQSTPKTFPWPGASAVIYPLISQASLAFAARTYPAVIQNRNVVKGVVWGPDRGVVATQDGKPNGQPKVGPDGQPMMLVPPGAKRERADKIGEHMSFQLLEDMPEWESQTDQMLHMIPVIGGGARKTFFDPIEGRNKSLYVSLMNLVWSYSAPSFEAAPRHSEKLWYYPHEIAELERAELDDEEMGLFLPISYASSPVPSGEHTPSGFEDEEGAMGPQAADPDAQQLFIEQHRRWDLDADGYAEPYVVTVHHASAKVVRIVARYEEEGIEVKGGLVTRITPIEYYTLYPFFPSIDGGSYPIGFGHLLRSLNESINTSLNQMIDAGTLQNAGGGFISDQLGIPSGQTLFQVGRYVRVTTKGAAIRDAVFPMPFQGPSAQLYQLLVFLVGAAKEIASIQDVLAGEANIANAPPTTVLALIEQGLKVYTAIIKRLFRAFKGEFQKLYALNRKHLKEATRYRIGDEWREVTPEDYRLGGGVEPVADPSMVTDMQKLARSQITLMFKDDPMVDQIELRRRFFEDVGVSRISDLLVTQPPAQVQQAAQLQQALALAQLGVQRSIEQKNSAQSLLFMAQARSVASEPEIEQIDKLLEATRLHLEAVNTEQRFIDMQMKHHVNLERMRLDAHTSAEEARHAGASSAGEGGGAGASSPGPAELAGEPPASFARPPASGASPGGLGALASQPGGAGGLGLPGGSGGGLPGAGGGPLGGGGA